MNAPMTKQQAKPLSANESARLMQLKEEIAVNLKGFVVVCMAVAEIQERKLYRENYGSVEEFFNKEFDLSRGRFYQLVDGARVVNSCRQLKLDWMPENEAQARAVAKLVKSDERLLPGVIEMAVEHAKDGKITASLLTKATKSVLGEKTTKGLSKVKRKVREDKGLSPNMQVAIEHLTKALVEERKDKYKNSKRTTIIEHLDSLRALVAEDGEKIDECVFSGGSDDANKLERAGFKLFRMEKGRNLIKERAGGGWTKHSGPFETIKEMEGQFAILMQNKKHLRG